MNTILLRASGYRFLAGLPARERQIVLDLIRRLGATFTDSDRTSPFEVFFASELSDYSGRYGNGVP